MTALKAKICGFLLLFSGFLLAQNVQLSYQHGIIIDHSDEIAYQIPDRTIGVQGQWFRTVPAGQSWHAAQGFPDVGLAFGIFNLGDADVLGTSFHLLPIIKYTIRRQGRVVPYFQGGTGLAYLSKHFDRDDNPQQTAIGSAFNNCTQFRMGAETRLSKDLVGGLGLGFTHYSNGGSQQPNLGINILSVNAELRLSRKREPISEGLDFDHFMRDSTVRKWGAAAGLHLGYRERRPVNGPKYPIHNLYLSGWRSINSVFKLHFGVEWEKHTWLVRSAAWGQQNANLRKADSEAQRQLAFLAIESWYRDVSVLVTQGIYLDAATTNTARYYNRLQLRYHFPAPIAAAPVRPFLSFAMKSHGITAEYLALGVGFAY